MKGIAEDLERDERRVVQALLVVCGSIEVQLMLEFFVCLRAERGSSADEERCLTRFETHLG